MKERINIIRRISEDAGSILIDLFRKDPGVKSKEGRELVTSADNKSERYIIRNLKREFPDYGIIAEESNKNLWDRNRIFIVDPLDGTHNFAYGLPHFCVSIALSVKEEIRMAVIHDPVHRETFYAVKGKGAMLNEKRIRVSKRGELSNCILATGFPYIRTNDEDSNLKEFSAFLFKCRGLRRFGSAALDLAYVACGRLDGFWEKGLKTWDIAAGGLIVKEGGGNVSNFSGKNWDFKSGDIVASNGNIHNRMIETIKNL